MFLPVRASIGLDIDGVLANWGHAFLALAWAQGITSLPRRWYEQTNWDLKDQDQALALWNQVRLDPAFWLSIVPFYEEPRPQFVPGAYITNRPIASAVTAQWLAQYGFPAAEVISLNNESDKFGFKDKYPVIVTKGITTFVEDRPDAFESLRERGVNCLLLDRPWSKHIDTKYRIYDVNEALKDWSNV